MFFKDIQAFNALPPALRLMALEAVSGHPYAADALRELDQLASAWLGHRHTTYDAYLCIVSSNAPGLRVDEVR